MNNELLPITLCRSDLFPDIKINIFNGEYIATNIFHHLNHSFESFIC